MLLLITQYPEGGRSLTVWSHMVKKWLKLARCGGSLLYPSTCRADAGNQEFKVGRSYVASVRAVLDTV